MNGFLDCEGQCDGDWAVFTTRGTEHVCLESGLSEEVARQMVADYAAEGEHVWMERTTPAPE